MFQILVRLGCMARVGPFHFDQGECKYSGIIITFIVIIKNDIIGRISNICSVVNMIRILAIGQSINSNYWRQKQHFFSFLRCFRCRHVWQRPSTPKYVPLKSCYKYIFFPEFSTVTTFKQSQLSNSIHWSVEVARYYGA